MHHILLMIIFLTALLSSPHYTYAIEAEDNAHPHTRSDSKTSDSPLPVLTLSEALETGLSNHSSIMEAAQKIKSAEHEMKSAKVNMLMKASFKYRYTNLSEEPFLRVETPGPPLPGATSYSEMQIADTNQHHWDLTLIQPLFAGFALKTQYDMTKLNQEIQREEKNQVILDLTQQIKAAYFNVLLMQKILLVAEDAVECLTSHKNDAKKLYDKGLIRLNDLLRSEVALANVVQDCEKARAGASMTISHLNILLNLSIDQQTEVEKIEEMTYSDYELEHLIDEAMINRPVFKILRFGLKNLEKAVKLTQSAYYPQVALVGSYEQNGYDFWATKDRYSNQKMSSVTIQAKWLFFEWGKKRADVLKVRHEKQALAAKIKTIEDGIKLEIKNALLNLNVARKNIETAEKSLVQAKENWRISNLQYKQRISTSTEVLDARTFLTQADSNYYKALYGYMISLSELERSVGKK